MEFKPTTIVTEGYETPSISENLLSARDHWSLTYQVTVCAVKGEEIRELITTRAYYPHTRYAKTCLVWTWINGDFSRHGAAKACGCGAMRQATVKAFSMTGVLFDSQYLYSGNDGLNALLFFSMEAAKLIFPEYKNFHAVVANN